MHSNSTFRLSLNATNRTNLLLQIAVPVLLIVFAIVFQINSLNESREQQLMRTRLSAQDLGATLAASIAGAFQNIDLTLLSASDILRNRSSLSNINRKNLTRTLNELQGRVPELILLSAADQNGDVLYDTATKNEEKINITDRMYFQRLKDNPHAGMVISEPVFGRLTRKWVIICARRFNSSNGEFGGVVYGSVELEGLTERLSGKEMTLNEDDAFVLRDDQSNVIIRFAHGRQDMQITGKKITSPHIVAFDKSGATSATYIGNSVIDNVERIFYMQRIRNQAMSINIGLSINDALSDWKAESQRKWLSTCLFILVVILSFFLIHIEQGKKLKVIKDLEGTGDKLKQLITFNEAIFLNSPLPIGVYTGDGLCIKVNEAFARLVGTSREILLHQNFYQLCVWENSGLLDACLNALENNSPSECEINLMSIYGKQLVAECHITSIQQNNENLLLIQFVDLTEIKRINAKLENILKSMNEGVHVIDENGIIILENDAATAMLGWQGENILGRHAHLTAHHHRIDQSVYPIEDCPITATLRDGKIRQIENDIFWRRDGTFFSVEYTVTPILNPQNEGQAVTVVFRDITYRKRLEDELRKQATHDPLTGLPNRRLLMDRLRQAVSINRRQNTLGALIYLDLNKFKNLNDTYGHEAGDYLLVEVANRLTLITRESDTVARLGGDEFVILLLGLDIDLNLTKRYVELFTEKLSRKLSEDYVIGTIVHPCSASIGVKIFYDGEQPEKILREADSAMYKMKKDRE